jgi:hypothetical protein
MRRFVLLFLVLATCSVRAEPVFYSFTDALASKQAKKILDPSVPLFFGNQIAPALSEKARPDIYTRSAITPFLWDDPVKLCLDAFADDLEAMIDDAKRHDYDVVLNIVGWGYGGGKYRDDGFECDAGRHSSEVRLQVVLGVTQAAAQRAQDIERDPCAGHHPSVQKRPRKT